MNLISKAFAFANRHLWGEFSKGEFGPLLYPNDVRLWGNVHQKYNFSNSNINKQCLRIFWKILIFTKTGWIQSLYFWFTFEPLLSCKHGQNWTIQICQNQDPFFLSFQEKLNDFLQHLRYFWPETGRIHMFKGRNRNLI